MKEKTGDRAGRDFKGGISESGTNAPETQGEGVASSATSCTGQVSRRDERRSGLARQERRQLAVKLPAEGNSEMGGTGILPADAPLTQWEILLGAGGDPFRVMKVFKDTLRAAPWQEGPDGKPGRAVTFTHAEARAMRRAGLPRALTVGDVLVWGDKPCRVTRIPTAEEHAGGSRDNPPTMTVAGDWLEAGELFDEEVPYSVGALHVRFLRFAMPAEREAFVKANKPLAGDPRPSPAKRRKINNVREDEKPSGEGE